MKIRGLTLVALATFGLGACGGEAPASEPDLATLESTVPQEGFLLRFEVSNDSLTVVGDESGDILRVFLPTEGAFLRGLVPALGQDRKVRQLDRSEPYLLTRRPDGAPLLIDPLTDTRIDVPAFGRDAVAIFHGFWVTLSQEREAAS